MIEYYEERFDNDEESAADVCTRMARRGWEVVQIRNHSVVFKRDTLRVETRDDIGWQRIDGTDFEIFDPKGVLDKVDPE